MVSHICWACQFLAYQSWKLEWAFLITFCRASVSLSICKLFTFSHNFYPKNISPISTKQSNFKWRGFKFVQLKRVTFDSNWEIKKIHNLIGWDKTCFYIYNTCFATAIKIYIFYHILFSRKVHAWRHPKEG